MNVRDLVELAALSVSEANELMSSDRPLAESALEAYWTTSKCRHERWHTALKTYHDLAQHGGMTEVRGLWLAVRPVVDEVLGSEVLSRVWAAILCQRDRQRGSAEGGAIARSVLVGHYEARHRALNVLVYGRGASVAEAVQLNRLRRRYEQWSDLLLGALQPRCEVDEFAVELPRMKRFAAELDYQGADVTASPAWQWIRTTLRSSFLDHLLLRAANADLNERIAASVLELFGRERDALLGTLSSPWLSRLMRASSDTRGNVIDVYFAAQQRRGTSAAFLRTDGPHPLRPRYRLL